MFTVSLAIGVIGTGGGNCIQLNPLPQLPGDGTLFFPESSRRGDRCWYQAKDRGEDASESYCRKFLNYPTHRRCSFREENSG